MHTSWNEHEEGNGRNIVQVRIRTDVRFPRLGHRTYLGAMPCILSTYVDEEDGLVSFSSGGAGVAWERRHYYCSGTLWAYKLGYTLYIGKQNHCE